LLDPKLWNPALKCPTEQEGNISP